MATVQACANRPAAQIPKRGQPGFGSPICGQHKACSKVNHRVVIKLRAKAWPRCPTVDPKHPVAALRDQHRAEPLGRRSERLAGPKKAATPTENPGRPPGGFPPLARVRLDHGNRSRNPSTTLTATETSATPRKTTLADDREAMAWSRQHLRSPKRGGVRFPRLFSYLLFPIIQISSSSRRPCFLWTRQVFPSATKT